MTLEELLMGIVPAPPLPVADIATDSRRVRAGSLFMACPGLSSHGLDYVADAAARGAIAVAYDSTACVAELPASGLPAVPVPFLCDRLGALANRFFERPSESVGVIGVTGTNGKSTVAWLAAQCLSQLGRRCAYGGTLGYGIGGNLTRDDDMTSPGVIETHRRLAAFRDAGALAAAIEVSSHALDQQRVAGVRFEAALFTNLSRDHLDYHGDMEAYGAAKARLFEDYGARHRIINVDTDFGAGLARRCGANVVVVTTDPDAAWHGARHVLVTPRGARAGSTPVAVRSSWGDIEFELPLVGAFNVANAACVLGLLLAEGATLRAAADAFAAVTAPPGRMQRVPAAAGPAVYVDYAHTPDALAAVLGALRPHVAGSLWCVFGCGGGRDRGKRPEMGRIALAAADRIVVTSDNPRSETPRRIIDDILAGLPGAADPRVAVFEDRARAIAYAIANAAGDDAVLIAGKGHEDYQLIGGRRLPFSDVAVAADALADGGSRA